MAPKVLIVLTSHNKIDAIGKPTGWYLPEFAHPWEVLHDKVDLTIASPNGGEAPLDPSSVQMSESDPVAQKFLKEQKALWTNTEKLSDILPRVGEFDAVFYVGGHGPMYDLAKNPTSHRIIRELNAAKKPVSAVCHGPAALVYAPAPTDAPLLAGVTVTGFSNSEEDAVNLSSAMPFMLETELNKFSGGRYVKAAEDWGEKVVVDTSESGGTVITGQNPASAAGVGKAILKALGL